LVSKIRNTLAQTYGKELGKASVTGYCIRFKTLKAINIEILEAAIRFGLRLRMKKVSCIIKLFNADVYQCEVLI